MRKISYDLKHNGFESEGYDKRAIHPTEICWTHQSCFRVPKEIDCLWKYVMKSSHVDWERGLSSFCVDWEHNIIVSCCDNDFRPSLWGKLYKISPEGLAVEIFRSNMRLQSPVIRANGDILIASGGFQSKQPHQLFCLSSDGALHWKFELGDWPIGSPIIDNDGNIYVCTHTAQAHPISKVFSGTLFCIDADGKLNWKKEFPHSAWYEPVISASGNIYLCLNDNHLHAFNKKGEPLWEIPVLVPMGEYPPIPCNDGSLLCILERSSPEKPDQLLKISENGEIIWRFDPPEKLIASMPAIDKEGNLYINMSRNMTRRLFSLDCNGNIRWEAEVSGLTASAPPVIGSNGIVYQQSGSPAPRQRKAFLEAFDPSGKKLWTYNFRGEICSTVLADNDLIYILANCHTISQKDAYSREMNINWQLHAIGDLKKSKLSV